MTAGHPDRANSPLPMPDNFVSPQRSQLPCPPDEVLKICLTAIRQFPKAFTSNQRTFVLICKEKERTWHKDEHDRLRMRKIFESITR